MKRGAPNLLLAKEAAKAWISALSEGSECALTTFSTDAALLVDFTADREKLSAALDDLQPEGGTNYEAGLLGPSGGLTRATNGTKRRVVVFLTDGSGRVNGAAVVKAAREANAVVYCVSLGLRMPRVLQSIAEQTGGIWFENVTTVEQAIMAYRRIYADATGYGGCEVVWRQRGSCEPQQTLQVRVADGEWSTTLNVPAAARSTITTTPTAIAFGTAPSGARSFRLVASGQPTTINEIRLDQRSAFTIDAGPLPRTLMPGDTMMITVSATRSDSTYTVGRLSIDAEPCPVSDLYVTLGDPGKPPSKPTLHVVYPNGGERFPVNRQIDLQWDGLPPTEPVRVEVSTDGGYEWRTVSERATGNSVKWRASKLPSDSCLLRVTHLQQRTGELRPDVTIPGGGFFEAMFAPDGSYVVTSESSGSPGSRATRPVVKRWDAGNGRLIAELGPGEKLRFSEDGSLLLTWDQRDVRAYDMPSGTLRWTRPTPRGIEIVDVDRSGERVLIVGGPGDSTVTVDARDGSVQTVFPRSADRVHWGAIAPTGELVAVSEHDGTLDVFDASSGSLVSEISEPDVTRFFSSAFSQDGAVLAATSSHGRAALYDPRTGVKRMDISRRQYINDNTYLAFSADGTRLAVESSTDQTKIVDVATGQNLVSMRRRSDVGGASGAAFIGDGGMMFVNVLSKVSIFDAFTGIQIAEVKRGSGVASAPTAGDRLVVVGPSREVQIYSLTSPLLQQDQSDALWAIYEPSGRLRDVAFSPLPIGGSLDSLVQGAVVNTSKRDTLVIQSWQVQGGSESSFSVSMPETFALAPGDSLAIDVAFHPAAEGDHLATLVLTTDGGRLAARLTGSTTTDSIPPAVAVVPADTVPPAPVAVLTDPTTFRSILLPSAVIPEAGTLTTGVYDVVGLSLGYAVTDYLMILGGGQIPIPNRWFGSTGYNASVAGAWSLGAKGAYAIDTNLLIGGGYQFGQSYYDQDFSEQLDSKITFNALWLSGGYGNDDSRLNAYLGYAFKRHETAFEGTFDADAFIYGLAYDYRIAYHWKLCAEGFFMRTMDFVPITVTARYFDDVQAFEVGLTYVGIAASGAQTSGFPVLPMLTWVRRW